MKRVILLVFSFLKHRLRLSIVRDLSSTYIRKWVIYLLRRAWEGCKEHYRMVGRMRYFVRGRAVDMSWC